MATEDRVAYLNWQGMVSRCNNPNDKDYKRYGGRGIQVCQEWRHMPNFEKWAIASGYKEGLTIDRIDVNGNYEPSNCRWLTRGEQNRNRRDNIKITINEASEICEAYATGMFLLREIGEYYNVAGTTIGKIVRGNWHIANDKLYTNNGSK